MRGSLPPSPGELPVLADLVPPQAWSADLVAASDGLFERGVRVAGGDGGLLVLGHAAMRAWPPTPRSAPPRPSS